MIDQMKTLAREETMCVLATDAGGKPYCSLMAFVADEDCREIYMVTHRGTQKYRNLMQNPTVSLLIDTRSHAARTEVQALTVEGVFQKIETPSKYERARTMLLDAHPHLGAFMGHAAAEVLCIKIDAFLLLNGLNESHYEKL
jgi:nitroimidazol reductase NimA-like FMN-containing flavoprotein (pyridoxamine 5'-phosphate oxidase superfamily)